MLIFFGFEEGKKRERSRPQNQAGEKLERRRSFRSPAGEESVRGKRAPPPQGHHFHGLDATSRPVRPRTSCAPRVHVALAPRVARSSRARLERKAERSCSSPAVEKSKMSVVGLDFGNSNNVVALARRKGIDVVLNTESKRETPSMVNFGVKQVRTPARVERRRSDLESSRGPSKAFCRRRARTRACPPAVIETLAVVRVFVTRVRVARRLFEKCGAPRAAVGPPRPVGARARLPRPSPPRGDARRRGTSRQAF